jgi:aconitase A
VHPLLETQHKKYYLGKKPTAEGPKAAVRRRVAFLDLLEDSREHDHISDAGVL